MKISIAVPSYNYARFIAACLVSIRQQTHQDFEVLIADGGSNDGTLEIINQFCATDARFRLVSTSDEGQADAIYKAFTHAIGDLLCFLNSDDCYLANDVLSHVIETFESYQTVDVVSFGGYYLDADGRWLRPIQYRYHPLDGFHLMHYRTAVLQPATFWRAKVYDPINWPKHFNFVFDVVFFYSVYKKYSWLELHKPVAGYRLHGENKSMWVKSARIRELADFEVIKFGKNSLRAAYLRGIAWIVSLFERLGKLGLCCSKGLYFLVNGLAYLTCYRLPSI